MNTRLLRWLTVALPVGFVVALLSFSEILFLEDLTITEILFILILASIGATLFSSWVFSLIDQREEEIEKRVDLLASLNEATMALTTELELGTVLQKVVDLSRQLVSAKYGALGVLGEDKTRFEQFITSGVSEETAQQIGEPPHGGGVFEIMLKKGEAVRLEMIQEHEKYSGFPDFHPGMNSLLGVPIRFQGEVIGDLYLAEKVVSDEGDEEKTTAFTEDDQLILEMFANQAAIAIDNARLYRQTQQLAILEERQRFGMDLHDGVIQSIYAVGLTLGEMKRQVKSDPESLEGTLDQIIQSLNTVVTDIRNYILELRPEHFQGRSVVEGVHELVRALRANTFMDVVVEDQLENGDVLDERQTQEALHIVQEALTNIQKHAHASEVEIRLACKDNLFQLTIIDDGVSIPIEALENSTGNGLGNMRERAQDLGGEFVVAPRAEGGTTVSLNFNV